MQEWLRTTALIKTDLISFAKKIAKLVKSAGSIGVARIFDWGGPKPQITRNDVIRNF